MGENSVKMRGEQNKLQKADGNALWTHASHGLPSTPTPKDSHLPRSPKRLNFRRHVCRGAPCQKFT